MDSTHTDVAMETDLNARFSCYSRSIAYKAASAVQTFANFLIDITASIYDRYNCYLEVLNKSRANIYNRIEY